MWSRLTVLWDQAGTPSWLRTKLYPNLSCAWWSSFLQIVRVAGDESMSPAQVLISWAVHRGTVPLVRTTKTERLAENLYPQQLSEDGCRAVNQITTRHRYIESVSWTGHQVFDD